MEKVIKFLSKNSIDIYMEVLLELAGIIAQRSGRGYLTIKDPNNGDILFFKPYGEIPEEKKEKYSSYSKEKASRLYSKISTHLPTTHTTSYQSRNSEKEEWGGAVYGNYHELSLIFSFSGMPELIDEAISAVLTKQFERELKHPIIQKVECFERNPYWQSLYMEFKSDPRIISLNT